jgi:hypothetical protein
VIAAGVGKQLDVSITVDGLVGTLASSYFYDPPTITSVSPGTGPTSGGFVVTISGRNFGAPALSSSRTAEIGGFVCVLILWTDSSVTCTFSANTGTSKPVFIKIQADGNANRDQSVTAVSMFSYTAASVINGVSLRNHPGSGMRPSLETSPPITPISHEPHTFAACARP